MRISTIPPSWLLLEYQWRSADALAFQLHRHLYSVRDLYKWNLLVKSEVPTIEDQRPVDRTVARAVAGNGESISVSGLETPRSLKVPGTSKVSGPVCTIFVE